jgi:hypothetical protein
VNAVDFLQRAHVHLTADLVSAWSGPLAQLLIAAKGDDYKGVRLEERSLAAGGAPAEGLILIRKLDPDFALFAFCIEPADVAVEHGRWFDHLVLGTFYERGAPAPFRPFALEWESPARRLGWFEWFDNPGSPVSEMIAELGVLSERVRKAKT